MSDESAPQQDTSPELNERHVETLMLLVDRVFADTSPSLWDTRGWDLAKIERDRWAKDATGAELAAGFNRSLEKERRANTRNWLVYKSNGGKWNGFNEVGAPLPSEAEAEDLEAEGKFKTSQNQDFVTGGMMSGDQIILHTAYGKVITSVDHILSFKLFQQDVLRYTKFVYPGRYRKLHERNVSNWLERIAFASEDALDDDSLPSNLFQSLLPNFLELAETEPERFERAMRQKQFPIKENNEVIFTMATILEWLRKSDPDHRFKRGELKTFFKEIYGTRFTDSLRRFNLRCCRIILAPDEPGFVEPTEPTPVTLPPANGEDSAGDQQEVLNDSGSGENNTTDLGYREPSEPGLPAAEHDDNVVQPNDGTGSGGTPASEALPF